MIAGESSLAYEEIITMNLVRLQAEVATLARSYALHVSHGSCEWHNQEDLSRANAAASA